MKTFYLIIRTYFVIIVFSSCYKSQDKYITDQGLDILDARVDTTSIEADGQSLITITAKITKNADLKAVFFSTNQGTFLDSNKTYTTQASIINNELIAVAYLQSSLNVSDNVLIKVSVPKVDKIFNINFIKALPDIIQIESPTVSILRKFGSEVPLDIYLLRNKGIPSLHQNVTLEAIKDNDSLIGHDFIGTSPAGSSESGLIKSTFILKDTSYIGKLRIIATVQGKSKIVSDTTIIFITN